MPSAKVCRCGCSPSWRNRDRTCSSRRLAASSQADAATPAETLPSLVPWTSWVGDPSAVPLRRSVPQRGVALLSALACRAIRKHACDGTRRHAGAEFAVSKSKLHHVSANPKSSPSTPRENSGAVRSAVTQLRDHRPSRSEKRLKFSGLQKTGWGAWIRTREWRNQNPLPYHLATPQHGTGVRRGTSQRRRGGRTIAATPCPINARRAASRVPEGRVTAAGAIGRL